MTTLVNCIPHPVRIVLPSGRALELPPALRPARLVIPTPRHATLCLDGEAVDILEAPPPHRTAGLPAPRPGTYYLVSTLLAAAHPERPDLLAPATGPDDDALRDADGRITGVTRLRRYLLPAPPTGD